MESKLTPELPVKETVDEDNFELALKNALNEEEWFVTDGLKERAMAVFMKGYLFSRQEKNSIDRDKVIEAIENSKINNLEYHALKALIDLLKVIKQL